MKNTALLVCGMMLGNFAFAQNNQPKPEPLGGVKPPCTIVTLNRKTEVTGKSPTLVVDMNQRKIYAANEKERGKIDTLINISTSHEAQALRSTLYYLNATMVRNKTGFTSITDDEMGAKYLVCVEYTDDRNVRIDLISRPGFFSR